MDPADSLAARPVPAPYAGTTCLFTDTATEDLVIDDVDGVTVVPPCSGHVAGV